MLFWHLACRQNPHIRQVCCGFAALDQLQNSYCYTIFLFFRGMLFWHLLGRENAHIRSSMLRFSLGRSFKIAIVIQFLGVMGCCELSIFGGGGGGAERATPPKIQAKA